MAQDRDAAGPTPDIPRPGRVFGASIDTRRSAATPCRMPEDSYSRSQRPPKLLLHARSAHLPSDARTRAQAVEGSFGSPLFQLE